MSQAGHIPVRVPEVTVEWADVSVELSKRGCGRPLKITKTRVSDQPAALKKEKRVIIE